MSPAPKTAPKEVWPKDIKYNRAKRVLTISFDTGDCFQIPAELLRIESPSAEVQGHGSQSKKLIRDKADVTVTEMEPVGNYAVRLTFDDGHDTGLFSWQWLYKLGSEQDALLEKYRSACAEEDSQTSGSD